MPCVPAQFPFQRVCATNMCQEPFVAQDRRRRRQSSVTMTARRGLLPSSPRPRTLRSSRGPTFSSCQATHRHSKRAMMRRWRSLPNRDVGALDRVSSSVAASNSAPHAPIALHVRVPKVRKVGNGRQPAPKRGSRLPSTGTSPVSAAKARGRRAALVSAPSGQNAGNSR
jgi:hypothetical protein